MPLLAGVLSAFAMASGLTAAELDVSEVLDRMKAMDLARSKISQGYSSLRRYTVENNRFGTSAEVKVKMTYSSSGPKNFKVLSETGSGVIRKNVIYRLIHTEVEASQPALRSATQITADNYSFSLLAVEEWNGRKAYVLQAEARAPTKYLFRGRVWIDAEDFAVTRIEASPAVNPSFWAAPPSFFH